MGDGDFWDDPWGNLPTPVKAGIGFAAGGPFGALVATGTNPAEPLGLAATPVSPMPTVDPRGYMPGLDPEYAKKQREKFEAAQAAMAMRAGMDYARQQQLANEYQRVLEGKGMSLAEQQMRAGQAQAMQQAAQMAASARGGTAGLMMAQRSAQQQAALGTAGVARDAAMLRAKEVAEARGGLGQLSTAMRGMSQEQLRAYMQAQENIDKMELEGSIGYQRDASGLARAQAEQETKAAQETAKGRREMTGKTMETIASLIPKPGGLSCPSTSTSLIRARAASFSATAAPAARCSRRTTLRCRTSKTSTRGARGLRLTPCPRPRALRTRRSFRHTLPTWRQRCRRSSPCLTRAAWRWHRQSHPL